jgi:hypothetical protein
MTRDELKDILQSIRSKLQEPSHLPGQACFVGDGPCDSHCNDCSDNPCDVTTRYAVGEEG